MVLPRVLTPRRAAGAASRHGTQGRREPVPTRVKTDRRGVGLPPLNASVVTHTADELGRKRSSRGDAAALPPETVVRVRDSNDAYAREQAWRRDMLRYLNS